MSKFQTSQSILEEVTDSLSEDSLWSLKEAFGWYQVLAARGEKLPPLGFFYEDVRKYRVVKQKMVPKFIKAEDKVCKNRSHQLVYLETQHFESGEIESVDLLYCPSCNAFWKED